MNKLNEIDPSAALEAMNGEESQADQPDSHDDMPVPESENSEPKETQATREAQAIADLSKFKEVTIDGQKMTYDELKNSIMRQADYTRKTQEIAEQRKYYDNVHADLQSVKSNPQLAAEFKKIYPKQFHAMLDYVLQGQSVNQAMQAQPAVPPEIEEKLNRFEQFTSQYEQEKIKAQQEALAANMEAIEQKMLSKYKFADTITVYTLAEQRKEQLERETGKKLRIEDINDKFLEPFFKASHEYQVKKYNQMQKELAKQAKSTHEAASDIGRGGGTPDSPPAKLKLGRGEVADYILNSGEI